MFNLPNRSQRGPGSPPGGNSRARACRPAARVVAAAVLAHRALRLVRLALCLLLLDWAAGGSCGQDPNLPPVRPAGIGLPSLPAPASPQTVSTPGSNDAASLRSPALREAGLRFATTNLLNADAAQVSIQTQALEIDSFKAKLETAQRQRAAHLYEEATPNYVAVLSGEASDELKRTALLELALVAQEQSNLSRALQILSQYLTRWPQDANAPEILLRQGLIYRQLGSYNMALGKFYATMTTALVLKNEHFDFYRTLVLQAQAEIAETLALQNKHKEAAEAFGRLLKEPSPALNRARVQFRYIHSLAAQGKQAEVVGQAQDFLAQHPTAAECAEVRFLLATGLKQLGRNNDALQEVLRLLQSQQGQARERPETLAYWQQRTGNEIANQLYQEGDFLRALDVYQSLLLLNPTPAWQCPVRYQIGLAYERLEQPAKAAESYATIIAQAQELGTNTPPSLKALLDMARWRQDFLSWQVKTEVAHRGIESTLVLRPAPTPPAPGPRRAPL